MKEAVRKPWLLTGYRIFAFEGPGGLKVERLAKQVGKNKSSFYHLFSDLEFFTDELLSYHLTQAKVLADKEADCQNKEELIEVIVDHKVDLLFNRQLRIHRENKAFEKCFLQINSFSEEAMIGVWSKILNLENNSFLAGLVFKLSLENFFLQITDETLNRDWLINYFNEIQTLIKAFKKNDKKEPIKR